MNRRVLKKLLPVLVVVAGGFGTMATVATSEAKPVDPIFTKPVEVVPTVTCTPTAPVVVSPVPEGTRKRSRSRPRRAAAAAPNASATRRSSVTAQPL